MIVPIEVKELYSLSPEDRRSLTIIEEICASGEMPIPPMIIIQGKHHMHSWYTEGLKGNELVVLSEKGFTNNELGLRWLNHFIEHTRAGPDQPWLMLLMDNHGSHDTLEFVQLARKNHVLPFSFPAHLTHVMQPLDVGVFQPYKHWHNQAVQRALVNLDFEYNIASFLRDLAGIRKLTFKSRTIKSAYRKAGIWPIDCMTTIQKMKVYEKPELGTMEEEEAPQTPRTANQLEKALPRWEAKALTFSSPTREAFASFSKGTKTIAVELVLKTYEYQLLHQKMVASNRKKQVSRRRVQKGGELTGESAMMKIQEREAKEKTQDEQRQYRAIQKIRIQEKKELHTRGVHARKIERFRRNILCDNRLDDIGIGHLRIPIPDPEKEA